LGLRVARTIERRGDGDSASRLSAGLTRLGPS
jgi:hypothetical protein